MANSEPSRAGQVIAAITTFAVLATVIVVLRLFTRGRLVRHFGNDDWLILLSLLLSWAVTVCIYEQIRLGLGRHVDTVSDTDQVALLKPFFISILTYTTSLMLSKLSILTLYLSFFVSRSDRIACFIVIGLVVAYGITSLLTGVFTCIPVDYFWNPANPNGKCVNKEALWFSNAALNIVSDFIIIALPMPLIFNLRMRVGQKVGLMLIFMAVFFTCITSVIRLKSLKQAADSEDFTWDNAGAASWSAIEANMAIICSCLPTLRPLAAIIFPKLLSSSYPGSTGAVGHSYSNSRAPQFSTKSRTSRLDPLAPMREEDEEVFVLSGVSPAASTNATVTSESWGDDNGGVGYGNRQPKHGHIEVTTILDQSFANREKVDIESHRQE